MALRLLLLVLVGSHELRLLPHLAALRGHRARLDVDALGISPAQQHLTSAASSPALALTGSQASPWTASDGADALARAPARAALHHPMVQRDSTPVESRAGHPVARAELRQGADPAALWPGLSAEAWRSALVLSLAGAAALTHPRARAPTPVMLDGAETKDAAARRLRAIVLGLLVFENSLTALCAKASRVPHPGQVMYAGSVAVLLSELLKITSCFGLIAREEGGLGKMLSEVKSEVFGKGRDSLVMAVPAMCFFVQNLLFYVALSRLSAVSYQLLCQTKTLTTAFFFVTLLGRVLTRVQWVALCLLSAGVGLVQLSDAAAAGAVAAGTGSAVSAAVGVGAVLVSAVLSGFAGVYTEKVVKTTPVSLWMRNAQLGLFSLPPALAVLFANRSAIAANGGLFAGFTPIVWAVVSIKGVGGLLNAACIKHADNILRSYATAASIVLTFAVRIFVTGEAPALAFVQGAGMVLLSVILYSRGAAS